MNDQTPSPPADGRDYMHSVDPESPEFQHMLREFLRANQLAWRNARGSPGGRRGRIEEFVRQSWRAFDDTMKFARSRLPSEALPVCRAGCSWCCYIPVDCRPQEALVIARWVRERFTGSERRQIVAQLRRQIETKARHPGADDLWAYSRERQPCAFLSADGMCRIYEVRPLACRGHHSLNVDRCRVSISPTFTTVPQNRHLCQIMAAWMSAFIYVCVTKIEGRSRQIKDVPWRQSFFPALVLRRLEKL